ncbi:MAG TPA: DUF1365 domain-containing protein [Acidothermaceae bacterium]
MVIVTPALYRTEIGHIRRRPWHHGFRYQHPMWLVDLANMPRGALLGRLLRFEARDHLGDPAHPIRDNVVRWVGGHGIDVSGDRIVMLANPRTLGYVFNPITVYWCIRPDVAADHGFDETAFDDAVRCIVAEVHNTYGGRHCYLLTPDASGRASVDKALYVSPFNPVDGSYEMRFTVPAQLVHVGIILRRDGQVAFNATLNGYRSPVTTLTTLRTLLHYPLGALRVMTLIRYQGVRLFLRGLPVVRRPTAPDRTTPEDSQILIRSKP